MTVETLKELKAELIELKKETEKGIDTLASKFASTLVGVEFGMSNKTEEEVEGITARLLAHGTILNKTKIAIEEELAQIEEAIEFLEIENN